MSISIFTSLSYRFTGPVRRSSGLVSAGVLLGLFLLARPASAQAPLISGFGGTVDYGTQCLSPNDDGSSAVVDLTTAFPNGLQFFDATHTQAYINTNGNITFSGAVPTYTPNAFPVANMPMIAPYWGDVDIRYTGGSCQGSAGQTCNPCTPCHNPTENGVWWHLENGRMIVTWDRVGYYSCHNNLRMSFQLILTAAGCGGSGDFDVEFRYNRCEWEAGDASGGSGGFGGTEAQAGFDAGNLTDFVALAGSMSPGIANTLCTQSNVGITGVWQFQIRSGSIICPDAGNPCPTGLLGVCAQGRTNCVGTGTECLADVTPTPEVCDNLDNDCDGQVDEADGAPLCEGNKMCIGGYCVLPCTEFCGPGLECDPSGICVEQGCIGITCPEGQRCSGGQCIEACYGVTCPYGQTCRVGRCIDLCQGMTCDSCTVCEEGVCVPRCPDTPCPAGESCDAEGHCIANACVSVTCQDGFHCDNGACLDDCLGATCPAGTHCEVGECVANPPEPDAGVPDAAVYHDAAAPGPDAGASDGGLTPDAGTVPPEGDKGCGCGPSEAGPTGSLGLMLLAALGIVVAFPRRRRRR
jgi:MYXO-CTERM domain-containing protein